MKRLQEDLGIPIFRKRGRGLAPTEAGEVALSYARRILVLNDELLDTMQGANLAGHIRVGCPQDFAKSQTVGTLKFLQKLLESQHLTLGDVVMMHVYLAADPAKDGKMDFDGMMAGYSQFFGTREQPNKPARTTVQVVLPAGVRGALVEIDMIAVRPK
jgi:enamine deaminase RidA (YjgF/YER057c/UK114 family)